MLQHLVPLFVAAAILSNASVGAAARQLLAASAAHQKEPAPTSITPACNDTLFEDFGFALDALEQGNEEGSPVFNITVLVPESDAQRALDRLQWARDEAPAQANETTTRDGLSDSCAAAALNMFWWLEGPLTGALSGAVSSDNVDSEGEVEVTMELSADVARNVLDTLAVEGGGSTRVPSLFSTVAGKAGQSGGDKGAGYINTTLCIRNLFPYDINFFVWPFTDDDQIYWDAKLRPDVVYGGKGVMIPKLGEDCRKLGAAFSPPRPANLLRHVSTARVSQPASVKDPSVTPGPRKALFELEIEFKINIVTVLAVKNQQFPNSYYAEQLSSVSKPFVPTQPSDRFPLTSRAWVNYNGVEFDARPGLDLRYGVFGGG